MKRRLALGATLVAIWVLLWDEITLGQVVGGAIVATVLLVVLPDPEPLGEHRLIVRPIGLLRLIVWFVGQFLLSNLLVARAALFPKRYVRPGVVSVEMRTSSETLAALVSNITALTPGMQPVDGGRDPVTLHIHVLSLTSEEEIRAITHKLETLVLDAFAEAVDHPDRPETAASGPAAERGAP